MHDCVEDILFDYNCLHLVHQNMPNIHHNVHINCHTTNPFDIRLPRYVVVYYNHDKSGLRCHHKKLEMGFPLDSARRSTNKHLSSTEVTNIQLRCYISLYVDG